jgi:hypothetical protein
MWIQFTLTEHCLEENESGLRELKALNSTLTAINDIVLHHLLTSGSGFRFVDPVRLIPVVMGNQAELDLSIGKPSHTSEKQTENGR